MARIRTIKPEFFKHYELFICEQSSSLPIRVAFAGLWCCADRDGKFKWKPMELKTDILPHDQVDFNKVLDVLSEAGFIKKYSIDGRDYGIIPSFSDHQNVRSDEAKSRIPDYIDTNPRLNSDESTTWKGKEGKGKEKERNPPNPQNGGDTANHPEDEKSEMLDDWKADFEQFWTAYCKKVDRAKCEQKFAKLKKTERVKLLAHVPEYVAATPDERYRKNPATYLNNRCWNDENLPNGRGNPLYEKKPSGLQMIKAIGTTQHDHQWAIEYEDGTFSRITTSELDRINYGTLPLSHFDKEAV